MKLQDYGIVAANIYFSATCNLECTYCFQPKIGKHMGEVNKKIIKWISSGKMEDDLAERFGENISCLSLWGGEPTINLPYLIERLPEIVKRFPKVNVIQFSSNISKRILADNIFNLISFCDNLYKTTDRLIKCSLQFSIDGPPEINDVNRVNSSGDEITNNITYLLRKCAENNINPDIVSFNLKATHGSFSIKYLSVKNNLIRHYSYFDELYSLWRTLYYKFPTGGEFLTFVYPGKYTQEDGKNLKKIMDTLRDPEFQNLFKNKDILCFSNQIRDRIIHSQEILRSQTRREFKNELSHSTACSACQTCMGITHDGKHHWCQATYFFDPDARKYIEENNLITDFEANQGFSFRNFEKYVDNMEVVDCNDELKLSRSMYVVNQFNNCWSLRTQALKLELDALVRAGQVSSCFSDPQWVDIAITYLLLGGNECIANNLWEFGSVWIRNDSQMKLAFNGTFESVIEEIKGN